MGVMRRKPACLKDPARDVEHNSIHDRVEDSFYPLMDSLYLTGCGKTRPTGEMWSRRARLSHNVCNVRLVTQNVAAIVRYCHHWTGSRHGYAATTGNLGSRTRL
jgi:hypothetical protein